MALTFYYHPLASYCHKVLVALYENGTPFEARIVDLQDEKSSAEMLSYWPVGKIPVLRDSTRERTVPETTIMIEYVDRTYPGATRMIPADPDAALDARLWDRFFDNYVQTHVQKIVADVFRPEGAKDPQGVADAKAAIAKAYDMIEKQVASRTWATGEAFTLADCAAAPALFYAMTLVPFGDGRPKTAAYFERLVARPSFARVLTEARPYFSMYPFAERIPERFLKNDVEDGTAAPTPR